MTAKIVLDYTKRAAPFTIGDVKADVDALYESAFPEPEKLIMWQHQLDWLVKDAKVKYGSISSQVVDGIRIWSIPLEVREA